MLFYLAMYYCRVGVHTHDLRAQAETVWCAGSKTCECNLILLVRPHNRGKTFHTEALTFLHCNGRRWRSLICASLWELQQKHRAERQQARSSCYCLLLLPL